MQECTLPPAELPRRLAEFDTLVATALVDAVRTGPTGARLRFAGPAGLSSALRDLAARERQCCTFFEFTVSAAGDAVQVEVAFPPAYAAVLDELLARAR